MQSNCQLPQKSDLKLVLTNKKDKQFIDHWLLGDDLTDYLNEWDFQQLNALERVLLAQRLAAQRPLVQRLTKDQFQLLPPNAERFNQLFETALKGSELESETVLGVAEHMKRLQDMDQRKLPQEAKKDEAAAQFAYDPPHGSANGPG